MKPFQVKFFLIFLIVNCAALNFTEQIEKTHPTQQTHALAAGNRVLIASDGKHSRYSFEKIYSRLERNLALHPNTLAQQLLWPTPRLHLTWQTKENQFLFSQSKGAYLPEQNKVVVYASESANEHSMPAHDQLRNFKRTVFHEWGHSVALRKTQPITLCLWAAQKSPWRTEQPDCTNVTSFMDRIFFKPHPLYTAPTFAIEENPEIPGRYALSGIHEYFAEIFAVWLESQEQETDQSHLFVNNNKGHSIEDSLFMLFLSKEVVATFAK